MSAWIYLIVAGLLEVAWATGLKYTEGFSRPLPTALTVTAIIASMWSLGMATRSLPIGTAYGLWVGIGATGAAILGVLLFREPMSTGRALFLGLMVVSIIGLKFTAPEHA